MTSDDVLVAPSVLSADFTRLQEELDDVRGADLLHFDVMDGHFVPNLSFGVAIAQQVRRSSSLPLDVHLMVENPEEVVPWFLEAGADVVTFHWEAQTHAERLVDLIHRSGVKAGVALNPATPVCCLESIIDELDLVLVMTVNPGFGGQGFVEGCHRKLRQLTGMCRDHGVEPLIEVDGGIKAANASQVVRDGARVLVAGSAVFSGDRARNVEDIRREARRGLQRSV
ncbi:ribulose-phosphate 3-epimerase [Olsenella massiliensis]|uniref:ribulose-phosphate 3-epimerase n=1 Tax=Olsenella massiliensis TaxID=1622075 RepID=UPI00071DC9EB|nr:ribulose-phosphate 3-epimerase [Olsenella massiliensis]